jgi:methylenetetrahydrofolate reductase (NADPH)
MNLAPISFEFFPPKTDEGRSKLAAARARLALANPEYFSVTFGAGGSTREGTLATVREIQAEGHRAVPHVSCVGSTRSGLISLLDEYRAMGITKLVALRGDLPSGYGIGGEFGHAADLVAFIRDQYGDAFEIWVAAYPEYHPQARSPKDDIDHFVAKMRAGATGAITQFFYNPDAYRHFCDTVSAKGVSQPIMPGIMPIGSFSNISRFADSCGAELPRWMRLKLAGFGDDVVAIRAFATEVVAKLVHDLIAQGCPGLHFFTLNSAAPSLEILAKSGYANTI